MPDPITENQMDHAAEKATTDLSHLDADAVKLVAQWWKDNYMKAGHKRLARALLATLKKGD
jgi:hypothetical protein